MIAGEADFPFDNASLVTERAIFREADDAAFAAVGLYAVLDSKQQAEERRCHCGKVQGSLLARLGIWYVLFLNRH